jgi:hypothetical protein
MFTSKHTIARPTAGTVTGGTGRFADVTGSLTESLDHNLVTGTETVTLNGTVSTPGSM